MAIKTMSRWLFVTGEKYIPGEVHEPSIIASAFALSHLEMYDIYMSQFCRHWGSIDTTVCQRVLVEGDPDEQLAALCVLGLSGPVYKMLVYPFLRSSVAKERWCSAICLSGIQEKDVVPSLCTMLTEFLPDAHTEGLQEILSYANQYLPPDADWWHELRRCTIARALRPWKQPEIEVVLKVALKKLIVAEEYMRSHADVCVFNEEIILHELGYRGVLDIFADVQLGPRHKQIAYCALATGWYEAHTQEDYPWWEEFLTEPLIMHQPTNLLLRRILMEQFHLAEEMAKAYLENYYDTKESIVEELRHLI